MATIQDNKIRFHFPNIHKNAGCSITLHRTLRVPSNSDPTQKKVYPLPPSKGTFPLEHTSKYEKNLDEKTNERAGIMIPMYQSEALWMSFDTDYFSEKHIQYPFALKISAGKRSAVTGKEWKEELIEKDYVIIPKQPWIDGFVIEEGIVGQFVAIPISSKSTVEYQLTGKNEFGGIQIAAYPMKLEELNKRFSDYIPPKRTNLGGVRGMSSSNDLESFSMRMAYSAVGPATRGQQTNKTKSKAMGIGLGGSISQKIFEDEFGIDSWSNEHDRVFIHMINSLSWEGITGKKPPTTPCDAKAYAAAGFPWFDFYSDSPSLGTTELNGKLKTISEIEGESEDEDFEIKNEAVKKLGEKKDPNKIKDGNW